MALSDRNGSGRMIYRLINGAHSSESGAGLRGGHREPSCLERIRRHLQPNPLTGSRVVNDAAETNVAQLVLNGTGPTNGGRPIMSCDRSSYSDGEVADVFNYVTRSFGAARSHLIARQVHAL